MPTGWGFGRSPNNGPISVQVRARDAVTCRSSNSIGVQPPFLPVDAQRVDRRLPLLVPDTHRDPLLVHGAIFPLGDGDPKGPRFTTPRRVSPAAAGRPSCASDRSAIR